MNNAVNVDPDFFEGTAQDGEGPGPHFITMLFIKDKSRIRNQLLKALTSTVSIMTKNLPNAMIHCIQKDVKLPPLSSVSGASFPTTRMQARNYLFVQNQWSLTPGMRNRPKLSAPKVGKDDHQLFDKNRGYEGPDRITAVMWVTASCNVKDALTSLQMELEGKQLQIRWKPTQKKNSRNQIAIYGLPLGFNQKGIMQELLYGLKECKKDLCDGNQFDPSQNIERRDMPLPLFNGYYKQATAPKAYTHSESLENSLNKNQEYTQNGCRVFHLEYDPSKNKQMGRVWMQFIESGCSKHVHGMRSKIFVLPAPGQQAPDQITLIQHYMKFHCRYMSVSHIMSHATITNLDKVVEVTIADSSTP
jgi:hypothetical protein